jgi:hypothetical protein
MPSRIGRSLVTKSFMLWSSWLLCFPLVLTHSKPKTVAGGSSALFIAISAYCLITGGAVLPCSSSTFPPCNRRGSLTLCQQYVPMVDWHTAVLNQLGPGLQHPLANIGCLRSSSSRNGCVSTYRASHGRCNCCARCFTRAYLHNGRAHMHWAVHGHCRVLTRLSALGLRREPSARCTF